MHFAEDIAHLLKLGKAERKVLEALSGTPHNPTYVIRAAKVPRATAYLAF